MERDFKTVLPTANRFCLEAITLYGFHFINIHNLNNNA